MTTDNPQRTPAPLDEAAVDGVFTPMLLELAEKLIEKGASQEKAVELAIGGFVEAMPKIVGIVAADLHQGKPELLEQLARDRSALAGKIEERWGRALGAYEAALYAAYELGASLHDARRVAAEEDAADTEEDDDEYVDVDLMSLLHGRACTVAEEVLCLLRGGLGDGAAARQRTLHELAVVITLISDHRSLDLGERYGAYSVVEQWHDMESYQQHAQALGRQPFAQAEVDDLRQQYEEIVQLYGNNFKRFNQWAAPLFPNMKDISFVMLEEKAGLAHLRPFYRHANHHVHAGPRAAVLNFRITDRYSMIGVGPQPDRNISETAHAALISLLQCTTPLVTDDEELANQLDYLVQIKALQRLVDDAGKAFARAANRSAW